jgi:hypothetical protein
MKRLSLEVDWLDAPPEDAFGPEVSTWARLSIFLDDECLTRNHASDSRAAQEERDYVEGPMSGLVEWLVETWPYVLWDIHMPFEPFALGLGKSRIPSLRDAQQGWSQYGEHLDRNELAIWQHRHSFGHGASNLALPSITLVPDIRRIGVVVDHGPPGFDPSVRFTPHDGSKRWPAEPVWFAKDEAVAEFERFVNECLDKARSSAETRHWADWMSNCWRSTREQAANTVSRREVLYGRLVADAWDELQTRLGERSQMLAGILLDTPILKERESLDRLVNELYWESVRPSAWKEIARNAIDGALPAYAQGYALATRAREFLGIRAKPFLDLSNIFGFMGIPLAACSGVSGLLRAAVTSDPEGRARMLYDDDFSKSAGVLPTRFSISAVLGRLLAEFSGGYLGAAHGSASRWEQTQRANAFAAEFLLPRAALDALDPNDLDHITHVYGISKSAASWHVINRLGTA